MTELKDPEKWPAKVRTTIRPDEEIEVDSAEYADLKYQGLLAKDAKGTPAVTPAAERQGGDKA